MTVSGQEAMVEVQASDRVVAPASGASAATIESLRARLLSERAASKEARQQAHSIAQRVSELQTRLDAEIDNRKKAEVVMNEVLRVLKAKGLAMERVMVNTYLPSEGSASEEEAAPIRGSKDGDSDQSCGDQSSGEEASAAYMEDKRAGSANSQGSTDDAVLTEGSVLEHQEGFISEGSSSDKTQMILEKTLGSDTAEVGKEGVREHEEGSRHDEQGVSTDPSEGHRNVSFFSTAEVEKEDVSKHEKGSRHEKEVLTDADKAHRDVSLLSTEGGEVGGSIERSSELLHDLVVEHAVGEASNKSSAEGGQTFANDLPCLPLANPVDTHQKEGVVATSGNKLSGGQQVDVHDAIGAPYPSNVEKLNGMPMLVPENFPGLRPNHAHSDFINNSYPYDVPHMYADKVHNASPAEAPLPRGPANFSDAAYRSREPLSSKGTELGRYPQAPPISDAILSLVDDRNGKLGNILMALQLAKQQLEDEEQASAYAEEKFETALPIPVNGNYYPGFYEAVPYQPPYRPWKPEPHNAAPIVHFPMSPTSDHEVSPFERHDVLRRSSSTSAYYMSGYDPYMQPKGELHLGNGITLYTD